GAGLIGGCGGGNNQTGSGSFPVLVFSDVHFQPFIPPLPPSAPVAATLSANRVLTAQLDAADISQWPEIFEGAANTANRTVSTPGTDTNYALFSLALASIRQNLGSSPVILFTGDFLGHGIDQLYPVYSVNKTAADAAAFADKTLSFVLRQIRDAAGATPVCFALGNCDSYTGYGPDSAFLSNNAKQLCTLALQGAGDQQEVISSITRGGYYSVEPEGMNVTIVALNTIALSPLVTPDPDLIAAQFSWFDTQLAKASAAGRKVWLLMHAPPGADEGTTGSPANDNGQITTATMMWVGENQATFMGILGKYPGLVALSLAGHTHMDEFRLMSPGNTLAITAGISPCFGNNPAYKIFTVDASSLAPTDYSAVNCNLLAAPPQFVSWYTFSQAYGLHGPLAASYRELFPALLASNAAKSQYQTAFYSGNTASSPITGTNWPVYWCGIGFPDQKEFLAAVNAF
ncbi:MAG TPA: metallophosphoesterase, partial [Acidobacteriaceae bacterium]